MKKMKFLGLLAILTGLFQCASVSFEKNPPFTIKSARYNKYVGGVPGVSGIWVKMNYKTDPSVKFDSLFFQNRVTKIGLEMIDDKIYLNGHFSTSTVNSKRDLTIHKDGKKEYGNKPPKKESKFKLKDNEAVISYKVSGKTKYYKVENIKKTQTVFYPSARPRQ